MNSNLPNIRGRLDDSLYLGKGGNFYGFTPSKGCIKILR